VGLVAVASWINGPDTQNGIPSMTRKMSRFI
jgi:hypothetical protein